MNQIDNDKIFQEIVRQSSQGVKMEIGYNLLTLNLSGAHIMLLQ